MAQKLGSFVLAAVLVGILLSSAVALPNFSAYAWSGQNHDDDHKKGKKDGDHDDKKDCKSTKNDKYHHECDKDKDTDGKKDHDDHHDRR